MRTKRIIVVTRPHAGILLWFLSFLLAGCSAIDPTASGGSPVTPSAPQAESTLADACPVTEPVLAKPPDDPAVQGKPGASYYFINEDSSIWASARWWAEEKEDHWHAGEEGNKVGWFRPEGAPLEVTGQRLDDEAPPLQAEIPSGYPTRFQASGLIFPTEGCWEVTARARDRVLSFVAQVEP